MTTKNDLSTLGGKNDSPVLSDTMDVMESSAKHDNLQHVLRSSQVFSSRKNTGTTCTSTGSIKQSIAFKSCKLTLLPASSNDLEVLSVDCNKNNAPSDLISSCSSGLVSLGNDKNCLSSDASCNTTRSDPQLSAETTDVNPVGVSAGDNLRASVNVQIMEETEVKEKNNIPSDIASTRPEEQTNACNIQTDMLTRRELAKDDHDDQKQIHKDPVIAKLPYFHPDIANMYEVNEVMKSYALQDGAFLIRNSFSKPGMFTVSVINNRGIKHFNISKSGDCYFLHNKCFRSIEDLVRFYNEEDVPNIEGIRHVRLTSPIMHCNSRLFRRHQSENLSVTRHSASSQTYTRLQPDTCMQRRCVSQDKPVGLLHCQTDAITHNTKTQVLGLVTSSGSTQGSPVMTQGITENTRSLPHRHSSNQKSLTNNLRGSISIDSIEDMPKSKPPSIPPARANVLPITLGSKTNTSQIPRSSANISVNVSRTSANISPDVPRRKANISRDIVHSCANIPQSKQDILQKNERISFSQSKSSLSSDIKNKRIVDKSIATSQTDSDPYYSTVRDMNQELAPSLIEHLQKQEIHGGYNGKCECGLYFDDAELPRGWSVHISSEPFTNGCIFFTSPEGETSWNLPLEVSIELSCEQQEHIRKLLESRQLKRPDLSAHDSGLSSIASPRTSVNSNTRRTSRNGVKSDNARDSLYSRLDESSSGISPLLRPVIPPYAGRQQLGHVCAVETSELDLVVHCSDEDINS